ncbi:MAG: hypothetical protein AB7G68_03735 [Nitrospiraceae bacterium]
MLTKIRLCGVAVWTLCLIGATRAADVIPPSESGSESRPGAPSPPNITPAPPPSAIDPGIQKLPETVPDPKAAVPPPVVDPNMVINPETGRRKSEEVPPNEKSTVPPGTPRR